MKGSVARAIKSRGANRQGDILALQRGRNLGKHLRENLWDGLIEAAQAISNDIMV